MSLVLVSLVGVLVPLLLLSSAASRLRKRGHVEQANLYGRIAVGLAAVGLVAMVASVHLLGKQDGREHRVVTRAPAPRVAQ